MTPPRSILSSIVKWRWFAHFRNRALIFVSVLAICVALALFPQRYRAAVTLTPTDPGSLGLSGTLGQLGAINNVFGSQAAVEVALRVGGSITVRDMVIRNAKLESRLGKTPLQLHRYLHDQVVVRALRGGIIEIEMKNRDADLARLIVTDYAQAIQDRLGEISRSQTAYKRDILGTLVRQASSELAAAQERYDDYRLRNRQPSPSSETSTIAEKLVMLQAAIEAKDIAIQSASRLYTNDNIVILKMRAEKEALQRQLAETKATSADGEGNVGSVVASSSVLYKLERELNLQRTLYDSYQRFLQGTSVEILASTANVRILEPPYVDTQRQYWMPAIALGVLVVLLWGAIEFYRLRPPLGAQIGDGTTHA